MNFASSLLSILYIILKNIFKYNNNNFKKCKNINYYENYTFCRNIYIYINKNFNLYEII